MVSIKEWSTSAVARTLAANKPTCSHYTNPQLIGLNATCSVSMMDRAQLETPWDPLPRPHKVPTSPETSPRDLPAPHLTPSAPTPCQMTGTSPNE